MNPEKSLPISNSPPDADAIVGSNNVTTYPVKWNLSKTQIYKYLMNEPTHEIELQ